MAADTLPAKWFCIGKSGKTVDGRFIQKQWLIDAAETYDPKEYTARVNLEHFISMFPNTDFRVYGDVQELKTADADKGELELWALIQPLPELVELVNSGQKIFTSMEIVENFADTGKAYLIGVAAVDRPSSRGTSAMRFSHIFSNLIVSEPIEMTQQTQTQQVDSKEPEKKESFFSQAFNAVFSSKKDLQEKDAVIAAQTKDLEQGEAVIKELFSQNKQLQEENTALVQRFSALETQIQKLSVTPATAEREAHTGGDTSFYSAVDF